MKHSYFIPLLIIFSGLLIFSSCGSDKNKLPEGAVREFSDMEHNSWINENTLVKEKAFSGKFSSRIDSINQFSYGFSETFENIGDSLPYSLEVNLQLFYPETGINSSLVLSIDSLGKSIYWKGIPLKDSVKTANEWKSIKAVFELPKKILPTDNLRVYVWNNDKKTVYIDDLELLFLK